MAKYEIDMTRGSIVKNIIGFGLPLMFSSILQLLYNATDIVVVSRWAGDTAMASVGATGPLFALITNLFIGLSIGTSVVVSKRYGAMDNQGIFKAVHTSVLLSAILGLCAMGIGLAFSRYFLVLMGTPEGAILDGASLYLKIIFLGVPAQMIHVFGAAILRSVGDTRRPMYILVISGIVNVVLNLIFVIAFKMAVAGVAVATAIANFVSMVLVIYALAAADGPYKLYFKELRMYKKELYEIVKLGVPAGLQSSVFSLSNTVIQSAINSFGQAAIVGCTAAANIEGFVYTSMNSFYQATLTCVSQNYGAKNQKRINKTLYIAIACVTAVGLSLGLLTVIFDQPLLSIYIRNNPQAIAFGESRMLITGLPYFLCGIMEVLTGVLRGLGYSTVTAVSSLVGACGFRLIWVNFILPLNHTIQMLFLCWPLSWVTVIIFHAVTLIFVKKKAIERMLSA